MSSKEAPIWSKTMLNQRGQLYIISCHYFHRGGELRAVTSEGILGEVLLF